MLEQLGQTLQSVNLASAQQAYTTLQQDFQQAAQTNGLQAPATLSGPNSVSVNG